MFTFSLKSSPMNRMLPKVRLLAWCTWSSKSLFLFCSSSSWMEKTKQEESDVFKCTITHQWHYPKLTQTDSHSWLSYNCHLKGQMSIFPLLDDICAKEIIYTLHPLKFFQVFLLTEYLCYAMHITHTSPLFKERLLLSLVLQEMPTWMSLISQGAKQQLDSSQGIFRSIWILKKIPSP